jgi:hypothetical protein
LHPLDRSSPWPPTAIIPLSVSPSNWSHRLPHSIKPLDGERMTTLRDVVAYMDAIDADRQSLQTWRHVAELLLDAAERNGSVVGGQQAGDAGAHLDGRLDVAATVSGRLTRLANARAHRHGARHPPHDPEDNLLARHCALCRARAVLTN